MQSERWNRKMGAFALSAAVICEAVVCAAALTVAVPAVTAYAEEAGPQEGREGEIQTEAAYTAEADATEAHTAEADTAEVHTAEADTAEVHTAEADTAEAGWALEEDGWHYYLPDGRPANGWLEDRGKSYYLLENGLCLTDAVTPDGYYVDESGAWYRRTASIFDTVFDAPEKCSSPEEAWTLKAPLSALKARIEKSFTGSRSMRLTEASIEYVEVTSAGSSSKTGTSSSTKKSSVTTVKQETTQNVLMGLYKDKENGRYRLDIRIKLNPDSSDEQAAATYDYAAFRAMIYQISSSPERLESAVYEAWHGENRWNISRDGWVRVGDSLVTYTSGNGYGRFFICPAGEGM